MASWSSGAGNGTPPALATAMEAAKSGAAEFGRVGRRIISKIWDREPINDRTINEPVWVLGCSYTLDVKSYGSPPQLTASTPLSSDAPTIDSSAPRPTSDTTNTLQTPPDSLTSSFDSSLAYEEPGQDGGWPPAFLDDFESRIWMTYRTGFELIPKSTDPRAVAALSFTMRLKTSFSDQNGFSSDTGWGCMIRSGQSLLANALSVTRLGRGTLRLTLLCLYFSYPVDSSLLTGNPF
jgi:cysteine protease ATG4